MKKAHATERMPEGSSPTPGLPATERPSPAQAASGHDVLLRTSHLSVEFMIPGGSVRAVNDMNIELHKGEVLCLLGESGSGKSAFGNSILRLLPDNGSVTGHAYFEGREITEMDERDFRKLRGKEIAAIPQSAVTSLNPLLRIGTQVDETYRMHVENDKHAARENTLRLFKMLGLPRLPDIANDYPHELSGGMRQRVLVAMGTAARPKFIVVDEPTKGLDWARKQGVIDRIGFMQQRYHCGMLLITHDFSVAESLANNVGIMYAGEIVECGDAETVLKRACHPYTTGFIAAQPRNGFHAIKGFSPSLADMPKGCRFNDRCPQARPSCKRLHPELEEVEPSHFVRCPYA